MTNNIIKLKSTIGDNFIYAKVKNNGMSYMWFSDDTEQYIPKSYQSLYNKYDLDKFHLTYFYPLFTCFNYMINPKTCLCIGLGGGHIPLFLQKKLPNMYISVVEIDKSVYEVAKYMGFTEEKYTKIYIENGITFIENTDNEYDVIIIDLDGEESFEGFDFLDVSKILNNNGILVINCYSQTKTNDLKSQLKSNFMCIKHYELENNSVYLCTKNLNKFENMMEPITQNTLSPIFDKYRNEFIEFMNTCKPKMILS